MIKPETTLRRWAAAESNKGGFTGHWDDLARVQLPRRAGFVTETAVGDQRTENIYDGTPMQAARGLANAVASFQWPEGEQSFHIHAEDDAIDNEEEAQAWMAKAEEIHSGIIDNPKARFRQARGEKDLDLVVFGTAFMFIGESQNLDNLLFQSIHLKDGAVLWGDEGDPQGMFRKRRFTVRQAAQRFGLEALSKETREKAGNDKGLDSTVDILHAVLLRDEGRPDALFANELPWADQWVEIGAKHEIKVGGFHEFPFIVPRWDTSSGEDYGRSPGMIALPDSNTLQSIGETMLVAGQRAADPPIMAPNDSSFSHLDTFPGALGYYDVDTALALRGNPFFTMESGANMPLTRDMQLDMRDQVRWAFFKNILNLPIEGPQMTATEIIQRKEEFIREIGPVFGRLESDDKGPTVERSFMIALRAGAFPPIPQILSGKGVRFEYESPVKKIRGQIQAAAARLWAQEQMALSHVDPAAMDLVNIEALGRFTHSASGLPLEIISSPEEVQAKGEARAAQQQAAQEAAQLEQAAVIADTAAGAADKAGLTGGDA